MKRKVFVPLIVAGLFSFSSVLAQDNGSAESEKATEIEEKVQTTPEELKLYIEQYEVAIEPLKATPASEITGGSNYEAKKLHLDSKIAEWEKLTGKKWNPEGDK